MPTIILIRVKNMKQLSNLRSKNNNRIIEIAATMTVFFIACPAYAALDHAKRL